MSIVKKITKISQNLKGFFNCFGFIISTLQKLILLDFFSLFTA
jgi:hypothetical protein